MQSDSLPHMTTPRQYLRFTVQTATVIVVCMGQIVNTPSANGSDSSEALMATARRKRRSLAEIKRRWPG